MKVLIGTTNVSKRERFSALLADKKVEFVTPEQCGIKHEPEESGKTPEENARLKAAFYGQHFDIVICNDSGLYFKELPIDDPRQPGLNIRTPMGKKRLSDEEMISYYTGLIRTLGGKVEAFYLDGVAVLCNKQLYTYMDQERALQKSFYMVDTPSEKRREGWPLDSLSISKKTGRYFVDRRDSESDNIVTDEYRDRLRAFLCNALNL